MHVQLQVCQWSQGWILCVKYIISLSTALVGVTIYTTMHNLLYRSVDD